MARARHEVILQKFEDGEVERGATVLTCEDLADFIFRLWTTEVANPEHQSRLRRLAVLATLTYMGGSRLGEICKLGRVLEPENLESDQKL